jgi:hypothetical protein
MSYIGATPTDIPLTSSDLADGLVTAAKLATDSVTTIKVVDDNVTTAKVLDNNVTLAKLGDGTQGDILYYGASGAPARLGFGTSGDFLKTQGTGANPTWATAGGKILQVQTVSQPAVVSIAGDGNFNSWSGLTVSITPTAASSKIFITGCLVQAQANDSAVRIGETIDGGSVAGVLIGNQIGSNRTRATSGGNQFRSADESMQSSVSGLVSPTYDLTEVLTYTWQGIDSAGTMYTNRESNDSDAVGDCTGICTLTVMEVAA